VRRPREALDRLFAGALGESLRALAPDQRRAARCSS
jgi:hypothetical protein